MLVLNLSELTNHLTNVQKECMGKSSEDVILTIAYSLMRRGHDRYQQRAVGRLLEIMVNADPEYIYRFLCQYWSDHKHYNDIVTGELQKWIIQFEVMHNLNAGAGTMRMKSTRKMKDAA